MYFLIYNIFWITRQTDKQKFKRSESGSRNGDEEMEQKGNFSSQSPDRKKGDSPRPRALGLVYGPCHHSGGFLGIIKHVTWLFPAVETSGDSRTAVLGHRALFKFQLNSMKGSECHIAPATLWTNSTT